MVHSILSPAAVQSHVSSAGNPGADPSPMPKLSEVGSVSTTSRGVLTVKDWRAGSSNPIVTSPKGIVRGYSRGRSVGCNTGSGVRIGFVVGSGVGCRVGTGDCVGSGATPPRNGQSSLPAHHATAPT